MPVAPDTQLGPYRIEEPIGAGGMGEVYRAHDTRLDRKVALKVLPEHLSANEDLRKRLDREARAISSLQHPNICSLFDVGHESGLDYLVMEYLEGETLGERLARGPLSLEETLSIGVQISRALGAAHQAGIIHRDLKPGNVMLTKAGVKLLDFGLAKTAEGSGVTPIVTQAGTGVSMGEQTLKRDESLTAEGTILGTFQYMAPEQLEGVEADSRTDIFALGAVLYEMATGRKAFHGKSQASLIAAIMSKPPDPISAVQPMAPPALDHVIRTCMAKDPDERWQTAADVARQLAWIEEGGSQAGVPRPVAARRRSRERLAWVIAAVLGVAATALAALMVTRPDPPTPNVVRFEIEAPEGIISFGSPRISPDGRSIAFNATDTTGEDKLWVRPIDALESYPVPGTEGANRPFWSPDSRHLGFFSSGSLKRVPIGGGPPQTLCDFSRGADGVWGAGGMILFDGSSGDSILAVSAGGGTPVGATRMNPEFGNDGHGWPCFLPDGERFVFLEITDEGPDRIMLGRLGSLDAKFIGHAESRVEYLPPGYLVFENDGALLAQPFDVGAGELRGDPFPLAEGIGTGGTGLAHFSGSANGTLIYTQGGDAKKKLLLFNRQGQEIEQIGEAGFYNNPRLSPDGQRLAVDIIDDRNDNQRDLWIVDLAREVRSRFTFDAADDFAGAWSPDGRLLYFASLRGFSSIWAKNAGGTGQVDRVITLEGPSVVGDVSSDGTTLLTSVRRSQTGWDLFSVPADGDTSGVRLEIGSPFSEFDAMFAPGDRFFAYTSTESGRSEVFLSTYPAGNGKWQVSTHGGIDPGWRADGKELYYMDGAMNMVAVDISLEGDVEIGMPRVLFPTPCQATLSRNLSAVSADGERFVVVSADDHGQVSPIVVVLNWTAGLAGR